MKQTPGIKRFFSVYRGLPADVYILFAATVVNRLGSFIMPLLTLILTVKAGFSDSAAGLVIMIGSLSQVPFLLLGGKLADSYERKKIIVLFESLGAFVYLICGFLRPGLAVVVLIIAASDLFAISSPALGAIVAERTPPSSVKSAYSLMYLGGNLGLAVGPALGGLLFNAHLDLLFLIDGGTALLASALVLFKVRGVKRAETAAEQGPAKSVGSQSLFKFLRLKPILVIFSGILLLYHFCYAQWNFLLPLQTVDLFGSEGSRLFSLLFSTNALTVIAATPLLTALTQRVRPVPSIVAGGVLYAASFLCFGLSRSLPLLFAGVVVMTFGEALVAYNVSSFIALRAPKTHLSRMNSLLLIVNGAGFAAGPAVTGIFLAVSTTRIAWLLVSALMALGAFFMAVFQRLDRKGSETEQSK